MTNPYQYLRDFISDKIKKTGFRHEYINPEAAQNELNGTWFAVMLTDENVVEWDEDGSALAGQIFAYIGVSYDNNGKPFTDFEMARYKIIQKVRAELESESLDFPSNCSPNFSTAQITFNGASLIDSPNERDRGYLSIEYRVLYWMK